MRYPEMLRDLDFLLLILQSENLRPTELLRQFYKELIFKKYRQYLLTPFFGKAKVSENG